MLPENPTFFVRGEDGVEYGPVDLAELRAWVAENRAGIGTEVRRDESNGIWQPWQHFPELVALLAEVNATTIVPGQPGLEIAPMWRRVPAFALDLILSYVLFIPIMMTLAFAFLPDWLVQSVVAASRVPYVMPEMSRGTETLIQSAYDLLMVLYFGVYVAVRGGTPAQRLLRMRVVDENGAKPRAAQSLARALVLVVSQLLLFLPMLYAFFHPQRRALHDLVAGTYVVEA